MKWRAARTYAPPLDFFYGGQRIKEGFSRLKNGEEYDALETRNQYLNDQRNDVVKSRDDLMKLIRDLDSTMVSVFKSAFDDTAAAFEKMFSTLFPRRYRPFASRRPR